MNLTVQRRLAAQLLKCSPKRVEFDPGRLDEIKEAITKVDLKGLINDSVIRKNPARGVSRGRARSTLVQRRKGRRTGQGSRKGKATARLGRKKRWVATIRAQRELIAGLKEKGTVSPDTYRALYRKSKGGFFRSRRHIKLYIEENNLFIKKP
jgi:large subunit ribosomal protein L19e